MIRKTIYERLFDQLTDDPPHKGRRTHPRPQRRQHHLHAGRRRMVLHCQGKPLPDGCHLWTGGIYNTPDAANTMPATLAPQTLDKLDADRLHRAVATALGVRS